MESPSSSTPREPAARPGWQIALPAWLTVACIQIVLVFLAGRSGVDPDSEPLYDSALAISSLVFYSILAGITIWIASAYPSAREALGLRRFETRWVWISAGVVVASVIVAAGLEPVLHAGEEQGLVPDVWRPERAAVFAINGLVVATIVPFAEELFFRGLGVRVLGVFGSVGAVTGTALLFGLAHGLLVALPALIFFALGLAWVRLASGSVWPGVIAHGAYNGIGIVLAFLSLQ